MGGNGPMDIQTKLTVLKKIYDIYEGFAAKLDTFCQKGCADCCTCNVTLTTLEGYWMTASLATAGKTDWFEKLQQQLPLQRFSPKISTNALAAMCARGEAPPDEQPHEGQTPCPLLESDMCPAYLGRPFGCRCMMSKKHCRDTGYADMDSYTLTVNTVVLQYIEHVDADGCSGNLTDVLLYLQQKEHLKHDTTVRADCDAAGLISNHPLTVLMVPPEHRQRIQPLLKALSSIKA